MNCTNHTKWEFLQLFQNILRWSMRYTQCGKKSFSSFSAAIVKRLKPIFFNRRLPHLAFCSCKPTHYLQDFNFWLIKALISPNVRHVQDIFLIIERCQMECIKYFMKYWFQNILIVFSVIKLALRNTRTNNIHQTSTNKTSLWNRIHSNTASGKKYTQIQNSTIVSNI